MRMIVGVVVLLAASVANADPCPSTTSEVVAQRSQAEIQTASDLFQKGKALQSAGKIEEACKLFESSLNLNPQIGIRLNVAECHELQGRLVEAHSLFATTAEEAARSGDRRASYAATRKTALEAKLVRVTLKLPEVQPPGLTLSVAGCRVEPTLAAVPRVVMPGKVSVSAAAPGHKPLDVEQDAEAGTEVAIEVPALVPYANPEEERKAKEAEALAAVERRKAEQLVTERELVKHYDQHPLRKWTFIGAGVGAAAVVTGAIFGVGARRAQASYDDNSCGDPMQLIDKAGYDHCLTLRDRGQRDALLANVLLIGGASAIAAAAIVYVLDPGNVERPRSQIVLSPRGAGLVVRW